MFEFNNLFNNLFNDFFDDFGENSGENIIKKFGNPKSMKEKKENGKPMFEYVFETDSGDLTIVTNYKLKLNGEVTKNVSDIEKEIEKAVKEENFEEAAKLRDIKNKNSTFLNLKKQLNSYIETENWSEVKNTVNEIIKEEKKNN